MINRRLLDFDFEKICSVSLSPLNCYACLSCGKYFQGRSEGSPAYMHALHHPEHRLFINLKTLKAYILPDDQEFLDETGQLRDVRAVLKPKFDETLLEAMDEGKLGLLNDLHGRQFLPGFIGLNQLKASDYVNVILQALAHVRPLRNDFLLNYSGRQGGLGEAFKETLEKIWNPTRFKAQTSPHEFLQAISTASAKRFSLVKQADPLDFLVFLLNSLVKECPKVAELFQGQVRIDSCDGAMTNINNNNNNNNDYNKNSNNNQYNLEMKVDVKPFFFLSLDLPPKPLFADPRNPTAIPQISLTHLLDKYNGGTFTYRHSTASAYSVQRFPKYLVLHINRFVKNNFVVEHNPTIVQFSPQSLAFPTNAALAMSDDYVAPPHYRLLANIYCSFSDSGEKGFGVQLQSPLGKDSWLEIENLVIRETQAQVLFMPESYIQIWEATNQ